MPPVLKLTFKFRILTPIGHICILGDVKEVRIIGGHLGPHCWPKAIDMVTKKQLPLDDIITHQFPLKDYYNGIQMVLNSSKSIKVMLIP